MKKSDIYKSRLDDARSTMVAVIFVLCVCLALLRFMNVDMLSITLLPFYLIFGIYVILIIAHYVQLKKQTMATDSNSAEVMSDAEKKALNNQELAYIKIQLAFRVVTLLFMLAAPLFSTTFKVYKDIPLAYLALLASAFVWVRRYKEAKSQ